MDALTQAPPAGTAVDVQWRAYELRPKNAPPLPADYLEKIQAGRPRLYAIAREIYGLEMNPGPFGFDSRPALIGAKFAEAQGHGPAYHKAVMQAYWQEAKDIADFTVLADLAETAGVERTPFLAALQDEGYAAQVDADIQTAMAYGLSGVPALVFADKYLVSGAQPLATLQQVVETIRQEAGEDEGTTGEAHA